MKELLPPAEYDILEESFPTFYRKRQKKKFTATFKDYGVWFNHVIKVEQDTMFSADHLRKYITRGAMMACSNKQPGVDIVIPICHTEQPLSRNSVTAILVQVKNGQVLVYGRQVVVRPHGSRSIWAYSLTLAN